jgi:hypothetical protein
MPGNDGEAADGVGKVLGLAGEVSIVTVSPERMVRTGGSEPSQ